jgi:hypothetical protein
LSSSLSATKQIRYSADGRAIDWHYHASPSSTDSPSWHTIASHFCIDHARRSCTRLEWNDQHKLTNSNYSEWWSRNHSNNHTVSFWLIKWSNPDLWMNHSFTRSDSNRSMFFFCFFFFSKLHGYKVTIYSSTWRRLTEAALLTPNHSYQHNTIWI